MEKPRLIPYSVHLPPDIHSKLKDAAGNRKASGLVRDAITLIIEGDDEFNGGYNKGMRDAIGIVRDNELASRLTYDGTNVAESIISQLDEMIVPQRTKKRHGQKA